MESLLGGYGGNMQRIWPACGKVMFRGASILISGRRASSSSSSVTAAAVRLNDKLMRAGAR